MYNNGTTLYVENQLKPLKKRYCGNKLSRSSYILLMILTVILVLLLVLGLSLYFAIIPAMIKLGDPKDGGDPLKFSKLNVYGFNDDGFVLDVAAVLPPLVPWLPASMKLLDPVFYIGSATGKYVQLHVPDMDIKLNQPFSLDMGVKIAFVDNPGLRDYIKHVINDEVKPNLIISSDLVVEILGTVWYRDLAVEKVVDLNKKSAPVKTNSNYNGTVPEAIVVENPNGLIRQKYPDDKRIVIGSNLPDIVWDNFDLKMTDDGMNLSFLFEMENPTIATLNIPQVNFGIGVNLVDFVRISLSPIVLSHGINEMKFDIGIQFVGIDDNTGQSLGTLLSGDHLTINGPIILNGASFAEQISSDFKLELPLSKSSESSILSNLPDTDQILDKSDVSVHVDGSEIKIPLSLVLPRLIPLPPRIEIPVSLNFGIFGTSAKAIEIIVNPIVIDTTNEAIYVKTEFEIVPVNTQEAADSLARAVNPILSSNPSDSSVGVGNIKFLLGNHVLKWSESLMKSEKITVPLKAICISCFVSEKSTGSSENSLPRATGMSVSQLSEVSGFVISASIDKPDSNKWRLGAKLGYFGLSVQLQRKDFISVDLPSGIHISRDQSQVDLKSRLILSHEPSFSANFQKALNAVRYGRESSIVSVTGIRLGESEKDSVQTFSRIVVELDAKILHGREFPHIGGASDENKPLGILTYASLDVQSSNKAQIMAGTLLDVPLSISIGSIFLRSKLDDDELLSVEFSPVSTERKPLNIGASLTLASGNLALSEKVAVLANKIFHDDSIDDLNLSFFGLVISPPGVSSGPGVIDQFMDLEIPIDLSKSSTSGGASLFDISALKENIKLSSLKLKMDGVDVKTMPNAALEISANVAYDNNIPIKIVLPYIKAEVAVQDVTLVEQTIVGIDLLNGAGHMTPSAYWYFQQKDTSIQDHIAKLVSEIHEKEYIETKVALKGIYFGVSETERMDVDISKILGQINLPALGISKLEENTYKFENPEIALRKASLQALPGKKLAFDAAVGLKSLAAITANIGMVQSGFSVNDSPLMKVSIRGINGNFGSDTVDLDIGADVLFQENESTPKEVASFIHAVASNHTLGSALKVNQLSLGFSDDDKIDTFSKIIVTLPADAIINRLKQKTTDNNSGTSSMGLEAKNLEVSFEPRSTITASASLSANLPYNASVSVPYLDARIAVDGIYALRSTIQKIYITSSEISGGLRVAFQDSEELENKLGSLSEAILRKETPDAKAGVQGIVFGFSEDDTINAFSLMDLELALDSLVSQSSSQKSTVMSAVADAYIDAMKINNIEVGTESGRLMKSSVEVEFNNHLNVTINGLGHLASNLAIDSEPIMETVLSGLHLNPGSNNMLVYANLDFVSSLNSQVQVAKLINDVLHKDPSELTHIVCGTGLEIGHSSSDYIKAFRKIKIGVQASEILRKPESRDNGGFIPEKLLENLEIRKNHIDLSEAGAIKIGIDLSVSNLTLPVAANIGYMVLNTKLENVDLATVGVHDFVISHDTGTIGIRFDVQIDIKGGDDIKIKVAQTAMKILDNGIHNASVTAKLYNIGFGATSNDIIDTFSLISADFNPLSYLPADFPSKQADSNRTVKVDVIYADVLDSRRLSAEVHGHLINFPPISVNVPYLALSSHMDGEELLEVSVSDILLKDGALSLNSVLYTHKNVIAAQKLAFIVGNILFHRLQPPVLNKLNMLSLRFGSSEESTIDIFELINLEAPMSNMLEPIEKVQESPETWIELVEMKSKISATGLDASVVGRPFPDILPFAAKNKEAGATAKIGYGPNGTQTVVNIFFADLFFIPGKPFTGKADIQVLVPEILPYLEQNVPNLFEWKNYDQNISVGWPVMTIGDPHNPSISFDPFDQIFMDAPPLFLWTPLTFVPKLVNPFKNGLGLDVDIHVPNPGPLFADFGFLTTRMYHKGKEVATVTNPRPVIIKNKINGGELFGTNVITLQVRVHLSRNPFKAWEELSDMIHNFQDYSVEIESSTPDLGRVEWLTTCFNHVPEYMTGQVVPMLVAMLAHIKLKVGPWTITPPERFRRGAQLMLNKLDPEHIKFSSSEVELDSDHFMAQGHISSFSGVGNAQEFEEWLQNADRDSGWDEFTRAGWLNESASTISEKDKESNILNEGFDGLEFSSDSSIQVG